MSKLSFTLRTFIPRRAQRALESVLHALSLYVVPLGIAILSLVALAAWDSHYTVRGDIALQLRVLAEDATPLSPGQALAALRNQPAVAYSDTKLSEAPRWFLFHTLAATGDVPVVEFPSRHAVDLACWDAVALSPLGQSTRSRSQGEMSPVKSGFALALDKTPSQLLCRGAFVGPARLTVLQWPADQLRRSVEQYHRKSGLLDGGMIVLTLFVLTTALINRQGLYVLFAGWLILNLRVGALSAGWDTQWLGQVVPSEWLLLSRSVSIALYAVATLTLYQMLFRKDLARSRFVAPLQILEWLCLPLLVAAFVMPYSTFLPLMWAVTGFGLLWMTMGLVSIILQSHTRVAFWFAASFGVTFLSGFAEVISAALGVREMIGVVNSVTAALASSLLAALAVAEQMRRETEKRIEAQAELQYAYEAMPVGLFTLDVYGQFLSANPAVDKMLGMGGVVPGRTRWKQFFADEVWCQLHDQVHTAPDAELEIRNREGTRRFLVRATLARGRIEGVLQDITEQAKATEQLQFMANNDPLTKIFNRRGIERMFDAAAFQLAGGKPLALAYLDLDRFKLINDLFGHSAGDEVLKQVCERISMMLAGGQQVGRVGGDEFVIVMPDTTIPLASLICRGIVDRLSATPYRVGDKAFHVRGSIGLIEVSRGMAMKDAVSTADRACREAKGGHSEGVVVYERHASAFHEREAELNLVARLAAPDATDGLLLEMQPIMSLKNPHASMNFEVLLRMRDADGKVMPAGPIIAAAERAAVPA